MAAASERRESISRSSRFFCGGGDFSVAGRPPFYTAEKPEKYAALEDSQGQRSPWGAVFQVWSTVRDSPALISRGSARVISTRSPVCRERCRGDEPLSSSRTAAAFGLFGQLENQFAQYDGAVFHLDAVRLRAGFARLAKRSPSFGRREENLEIVSLPFRGEAEPAGGAVIKVTRQRDQASPRGHRPGVMIAALDFVPRIVTPAIVAVVNAANDAQAFADQPLVEQARRRPGIRFPSRPRRDTGRARPCGPLWARCR